MEQENLLLYYERHKSAIKLKQKIYYQKHKKKLLTRAKNYYEKNKDDILVKNKQSERKRRYDQAYYHKNKKQKNIDRMINAEKLNLVRQHQEANKVNSKSL